MTTESQGDLFGPPPTSAADLKWEVQYGQRDAGSGLGIRNHYSGGIAGDRLAAYERAFREERAKQSAEEK